MADKEGILRLLGLALKAGQLQLGAGPVKRLLAHDPPGIVFLATDAGRTLVRNVRHDAGQWPVVEDLFDSEELSRAFGRRQLAVVAVRDPGFVRGLQKLLSETG